MLWRLLVVGVSVCGHEVEPFGVCGWGLGWCGCLCVLAYEVCGLLEDVAVEHDELCFAFGVVDDVGEVF